VLYTKGVLTEKGAGELLAEHRGYESARDRVWLERIRVGLEYRRAMREVDESVYRRRESRDQAIRAAVAGGASYREVARALGLSHSRIQQIVNAARKQGPAPAASRKPR
jgi:DNA-directed RNA polymerase specialized sigma24 family protein